MEVAACYAYARAAQLQMQLEMVAVRQAVEGQRQMADLLAAQADGVSQPATGANPAHLGGQIDAYA